MEHVTTGGDPGHVHLLQAHGTRAPSLPQLLLYIAHIMFLSTYGRDTLTESDAFLSSAAIQRSCAT